VAEGADKLFKLLDELIELYSKSNLTETDTRCKLIDPLFVEGLGWSEKDIEREHCSKPDFIDYIFRVNGTKKFVLEAKRNGVYFDIPKSFSQRRYVINGAISTAKPIADAINQAQKYCVDIGIKYAIISNGYQYILFEAFRYGESWKDKKCIVFRSLEDIKNNCTLFYNLLAKENVEAGSLRQLISEESILSDYRKPIEDIHNPDVSLVRNYLTPYIQPFINRIFGPIVEDSQLDILRFCYIREVQLAGSSSSLLIRRLFETPPYYAKKFDFQTLFQTDYRAGGFHDSFEKCQRFLKNDVPKGSLIVLEGGVGTGKTTFVHHFFKIVLNDPKVFWFYVDFKETFPDAQRIEQYVFDNIVDDFNRRYRSRVDSLLKEIGIDNISADNNQIVILFSLLRAHGYTLSLVLDNVDKHYLTNKDFQEKVLLVARNFTARFKTITILTLREESFFKSIKSGVLDQFDIPKFHVPVPYFDALLRRRIRYALRLLDAPDSLIREKLDLSSDIEEGTKEELRKFFRILILSLRKKRTAGKEILRFVCDVSGGDMREALRFVTTYFVSGNTNVKEMLDKYDRNEIIEGIGSYDIPLHHVVKSIMLGDFKYYRGERSDVLNVFDVNPTVSNVQFLFLHLLSYLKSQVNSFSELDTGYILIGDLLSEAEKVSVSQKAVGFCLKKLALHGLVEFDNQSSEGYDTAHYVRITSTGQYYLSDLIAKFSYLDLVLIDTPIRDKEVLNLIRKSRDTEIIEERFERTEAFLNYLKRKEDEEVINNPEFKDTNVFLNSFMDEIIEKFKTEKQYIQWKNPQVIENLSDPE
jgi:KaiC/GvpD/RAD55 family RecA-like ATPase